MQVRADRQHEWNVSPAQAVTIQEQLRRLIRPAGEAATAGVQRVAGIDVGVKNNLARAAVVVLSYPGLTLLDLALAEETVRFPYVPGLLTFREGPVALAALARLQTEPDLLIFDGQGIAHPRRMGIAAHIGLLLDRPSIGCAKSRLWGAHDEPGQQKGDWAPLYDGQEIIGAVLRTRPKVKPVYVSIGHGIDLSGAVQYVLGCSTRYRLPETTRLAHRAAGGQALAARQQPLIEQGEKV